jgi:hypothetical protein
MSHPVSVIATFTPALCKALNDRTLDVAIVRPPVPEGRGLTIQGLLEQTTLSARYGCRSEFILEIEGRCHDFRVITKELSEDPMVTKTPFSAAATPERRPQRLAAYMEKRNVET